MRRELCAFWKNIKSERVIILTILGFIFLGLFFWLCSNKMKDFGLNFFTEMLGVGITIFVIDRLIKNKEERRNIPQKLAAYEDVRLYASRYIDFWVNTYKDSVPEDFPETIELFFSNSGMAKILNHLYMDSEANVIPSMKSWSWVLHNAKEFKNNGDKILDRHSQNLDPIVFGYVHQLTESAFNNMLLMFSAIRQSDIQMKTPRVEVLGSYSIAPLNEDYEAILGLVKWCNDTYISLKKHSKSIKKNYTYTPMRNSETSPKCMIPQEILNQQIIELEEFRQRNK